MAGREPPDAGSAHPWPLPHVQDQDRPGGAERDVEGEDRDGPGPDGGVRHRRDGGRGVYFADPDGHLMEVLTRPYGSGG